jgi:hypothetical protein
LFGIFLAAAGRVAAWEGSCWSARSRAAARTNELDADERRLIIGSGEGSFRAGGERVVLSPVWLAEWSRKHPSGVWSCGWADAMTMCPGTGLLSQKIERGRWPTHAALASVPGAW